MLPSDRTKECILTLYTPYLFVSNFSNKMFTAIFLKIINFSAQVLFSDLSVIGVLATSFISSVGNLLLWGRLNCNFHRVNPEIVNSYPIFFFLLYFRVKHNHPQVHTHKTNKQTVDTAGSLHCNANLTEKTTLKTKQPFFI